jgi:hypothetical protein
MSVDKSLTFDIVRWDAVIDKCSLNPKPFLYFTPTLELLEFFERNLWRVRVVITGSQSTYDNKILWGVVQKSAFEAGCRPNYYAATELYTIALRTIWNGYPKKLGKFSIVKGPVYPNLPIQMVKRITEDIEKANQKIQSVEAFTYPVPNTTEVPLKPSNITTEEFLYPEKKESFIEGLGKVKKGVKKGTIAIIVLSIMILLLVVLLAGCFLIKKKKK